VRVAGWLSGLALLAVLAIRLGRLWSRDPVDLGSLDAGVLIAAVVASVVAVAAYGAVWIVVLRGLGVHAEPRWITLFFKSQLAKYLPGSVWQYAGRVALARRIGVPTSAAVESLAVEVVASALAAGAVGLLVVGPALALPIWLGIVVAAIAARALVLRRPPHRRPSSGRAGLVLRVAPAATGLYVLVWGAYGCAFWLTARALLAVPAGDIPVYAGVFSVAWLAGLAAVFAPGGIGVREAVIVALLTHRIGESSAIVVAGMSRLTLMLVDLVAGSVSLPVPALRRAPAPVGRTDV